MMALSQIQRDMEIMATTNTQQTMKLTLATGKTIANTESENKITMAWDNTTATGKKEKNTEKEL